MNDNIFMAVNSISIIVKVMVNVIVRLNMSGAITSNADRSNAPHEHPSGCVQQVEHDFLHCIVLGAGYVVQSPVC
jgi:hypothetical protein